MATVRKREWVTAGETRQAWVADYFDQVGQRHIRTFPTRRDAVDWLAETTIEVKRRTHTPRAASPTIAEAGQAWLDRAEREGLEPSTTREYQRHLKYLSSFAGRVKLADLGPADIEALRGKLHKKGASADLIGRIITALGAILAEAMANGQVARNVVRDAGRSRQSRLQKRHDKRLEVGTDIPTKDEIRAMLAAAQGRARPLIVTAVFTGLRASELRGLRWSDVELEAATLTVRQRADRWNTIGSPKSASSQRAVPLVPMVANALREWRLVCPKGPLDLVFPNALGRVQTLGSFHYRLLAPLQKAAGITSDKRGPKYGMHAFRHAAASLFIEQGFGPKRVQALMGHSTIAMTFDTYGHLFPQDDEREAMRQLQARVVGSAT